MIERLSHAFGRLLENVLIVLMILLTAIVIAAVFYRKVLGASLTWYDEIASIALIWVTYYGAALAALRRKHIGFDGALIVMPLPLRMIGFVTSEILVIGFFLLMGYGGWLVYQIVEGDNLVSLTWVSQQIPQSVIPIGAALFIIAECLSIPAAWRANMAGISLDHVDIDEEGKAK